MATAALIKSETPLKLEGEVLTVTFHNADTGFFVAKVESGKNTFVVTGSAPSISPGERLQARGAWTQSKWGRQFKSTELQLQQPSNLGGSVKYLQTSVDGIGPAFAKKLVDAFGASVFDVIENEPHRLHEVPGVGKKRAEALHKAYVERKGVREIMVFLFTHGLPAARAKQVHDKWNNDAITLIKKDPYSLCREFKGIGFLTADKFAKSMGVPHDSEVRAKAGVEYVLDLAMTQGSCGLPVSSVEKNAPELLGVELPLVQRAIELCCAAGSVVKDFSKGQECLFLAAPYLAEKALARRLYEKSLETVEEIENLDSEIMDAEMSLGISLSPGQRVAVRLALSKPLCVITGGPGTGKTTVTRVITRVLQEAGLDGLMLMAPTGKAANRLSEASGLLATTVHRALEVSPDGGFKRNEKNPLQASFVQCDEFSMSDVFLSNSLLSAVPPGARVLLVGDKDQLPSVGPGKVLSDIIDSGVIPVATLDTIFRQAASSKIIVNAHKVNHGGQISPEDDGEDFRFLDYSPPNPKNEVQARAYSNALLNDLLSTVKNLTRKGYDPIKDVQVLAPTRKGPLGTEELNLRLQALLNPAPREFMMRNGFTWKTGDKVMQRRNDYKKLVFNGEIGFIQDVNPERGSMVVRFNGEDKVYLSEELIDLTLAYAFTIHKSQGSEFPVVVTPLTTSHYVMLRRNLLYTAITRAKKLFILFGTKHAVNLAVQTNQNDERYSRLVEWLQELSSKRAPVSGL